MKRRASGLRRTPRNLRDPELSGLQLRRVLGCVMVVVTTPIVKRRLWRRRENLRRLLRMLRHRRRAQSACHWHIMIWKTTIPRGTRRRPGLCTRAQGCFFLPTGARGNAARSRGYRGEDDAVECDDAASVAREHFGLRRICDVEQDVKNSKN